MPDANLPDRVDKLESTVSDHDRVLFELTYHLRSLSAIGQGFDKRLKRLEWILIVLIITVLIATDQFDEHIARLFGA